MFSLSSFWIETEEGEDGYAEDGSQHAVARSYEWLVAVLTHLSGTHAFYYDCYWVLFLHLVIAFCQAFSVVKFLTALRRSEARPRTFNTSVTLKILALLLQTSCGRCWKRRVLTAMKMNPTSPRQLPLARPPVPTATTAAVQAIKITIITTMIHGHRTAEQICAR